jgi:hypothetical protein
MKANYVMIALAIGAWVGTAAADAGDYRIEVDALSGTEDHALQGYVLLGQDASFSRAVGTVGRAFSMSRQPGNTVWGVVTEAINFPQARGHVVGIESGVANLANDNDGELRGIDVVFKDRGDADLNNPVPDVGLNRFNESSAAVYISAQPRSSAGEFSGWQAGIRFAPTSVDRSLMKPYAVAIDTSDVQVAAPFYLIVWRCGAVKCGLRATENGAEIVNDIDAAIPK